MGKYRAAILLALLTASVSSSSWGGIKNEIIYQIITDRFFDGDARNNCGENDKSLGKMDKFLDGVSCDPSRKDWNKYWGGDFEGIIAKLDYLKSLGVTKIWISPVIENARGLAYGDGTLKTAYHGFWGRDWFRLNEHWTGSGTTDFGSFDRLVKEAGKAGIGVIVDAVVNHSNPAYEGEFGAVYENGGKKTDYLADKDGWFHKYPGIKWDMLEDPAKLPVLFQYMFQNDVAMGKASPADWEKYRASAPGPLKMRMAQDYKLADLADFDTDNPRVRDYMKRAHEFWAAREIAGYRIDTIKHVPQTYWKEFAAGLLAGNKDLVLVGEWYGGGPGDDDSMKFVEGTGISIFDFRLRGELKDLFLGKKDVGKFSRFLQSSIVGTRRDAAADLVTFIDNHDMPRMQSEGATDNDVLEMMKILFGIRGVPCVYYGLEVFLHNQTDGGRDPYNREMMVFGADSKAPGVKLLGELARFRKQHLALRYGITRLIAAGNSEAMIMREYQDDSVIVCIHASGAKARASCKQLPKGYEEVAFGAASGKTGKWKVRYFSKLR